ncbi:uncharacterized protein LOC117340268 [Pecten maximus]|uniref:uncharacterized protein LOC117340268 n=1 Tax=Pecten maximus TaxID=6579 RepID=UPI001457ECA3|nr:uncharacterized protein LOC117340268 [Pecten maximus]
MEISTIPPILIPVSNTEGSYTDTTTLTEGHSDTESVLRLEVTTSHGQDVSLTTDEPSSRTKMTTMKLDQYISRAQEGPLLSEMPPLLVNDTGIELAKLTTGINNSTEETNGPLSHVTVTLNVSNQLIPAVKETPLELEKQTVNHNLAELAKPTSEISAPLDKTTSGVDETVVKLVEATFGYNKANNSGVNETLVKSEKPAFNINETSVLSKTSDTNSTVGFDKATSGVIETSVSKHNETSGENETSVRKAKETSGVNKTSVRLDNETSGVKQTSMRLDKQTSGAKETSVKLSKETSGVNKTTVRLDNETSGVNETSARLAKETSGVNETSAKLAKETSGVNETSARLAKETSGVNETSARLAKETSAVKETSVILAKESSGVNETSVKLDRVTSSVIKTPAQLDKVIPGVNETSVKLDRVTSPVNIESVQSSVRSPVNSKKTEHLTNFKYPLDIDMVALVKKLKSNKAVDQKPIFPYTYTFSYHRIDRCEKDPPFFIFLIKSALRNFENRTAIRSTWAHSKLQKKYNFVTVFFVGTSENKASKSAFKKESSKYKDIVQMSFRDDYYNNTLKTIGAIHWTVKHCNRSKFVVFVDDDMLVSTKTLYHYMRQRVAGQTFFGGRIITQYPQRRKKDKWYVSFKDYPYKLYPPMPSGGFLIMTMNFVIDLHHASQYTKKFIYDDCYLAILAYKLHVAPVDIPTVYMEPIHPNRRLLRSSIAIHGYDPDLLRHVWHLLKRGYNKHRLKP